LTIRAPAVTLVMMEQDRVEIEVGEHRVDPAVKPDLSGRAEASMPAPTHGRAALLQRAMLLSLQRYAGNAAVSAYVQRQAGGSSVLDVVGKGGGQPLDPELREEMEARLGDDFSDVRVHTDPAAARSATEVQARAYTVGHEVVFGSGTYAPHTPEGRHTIAHELTHVQQPGRPLRAGGRIPRHRSHGQAS
jgi:hypothetical protein